MTLIRRIGGVGMAAHGDVDICTGGTATADNYYSTYTPSKAFDDNSGTSWWTQTTATHWIKYDLGDGIAKTVGLMRIRGGAANFGPKDIRLEGSNNDSNWTEIASVQVPNDTNLHEYLFDTSAAYRYFRITVDTYWDATWKELLISEIELM